MNDAIRSYGEGLDELAQQKATWDSLGKVERVSWENHSRLGATLTDVIGFAPNLITAHDLAGKAMRADEEAVSAQLQAQRLVAVVGSGSDLQATTNLGLSYKAFFFFVRSCQDAVYAVGLNLLGMKAGANAKMSNALKDANPIGEILKAEAAGYLEWFDRWRDLRNRIKFGVGLATLGPSTHPGISFTYQDQEGGLVIDFARANAVRLNDATTALVQTKRAVALLCALRDAEPEES
jgi:hypothetical protein